MQPSPITIPYLHRVSRGLVKGAFFFSKFGLIRQDNVPALWDVWQYGSDNFGNTNYVYPLDGTAPINRFSSSDINDDFPIYMIGLDINGNWIEQVGILDGQNSVILGTPLWRCFTAFNAGATTSPIVGSGIAGNIHWYNNAAAITNGVPDVASETKCFISNGRNRTLQAFFTSPMGYTTYLIYSRFSLVTKIAAQCQAELYFREYGKYPQIIDTGAFGTTGTSVHSQYIVDPVPIAGRTDIIPRISVDTNDTTISILFTYLLIQNGFEEYA